MVVDNLLIPNGLFLDACWKALSKHNPLGVLEKAYE